MKVKVNYVCDKCMKDIDIDNDSYFESTFDNYLCFECGDKVLSFEFEEIDYPYIDYDVFNEYDESCECWKLEEKR